MQAGADTCQFIDGEPSPDDSCKCLKPAVPGRAWCAEHLERVYQRVERGEAA